MMEIKLLVALCALLLINLGSADHDATRAPVSNAANSDGGKGASEAPAPESVPSSGQEPVIPTTAAATHLPDTDSSSRVTSNVTTTEGTPELNNRNDTNNETSSEVAGSKKNLTDQATTQPPNPPSESNSTTSHIPLATTINPTHTDHTAPVDSTLTTAQATNTSDHAKSAAPTQKLETNPSPTTIIIIIKETSPTSKDSSSEKLPTSETSTVHAPQPDEHPGTTAASHQINTSPTLRSLSTQTRADVPSKLNVEGNTTMVHDSHTLDPLLAGLVSAFIITAVIITVLLFLKLRRRDNRPEFRRLQDLPMDDMMEDTPLSMYSY